MADWTTVSALVTGGGTLVLAATTYASVRSANRAARVAEASLLADLRPLLVESSDGDETIRVNFKDLHGIAVAGGHAAVELVDGNVFLVLSLKNVGRGIAVLHGGFVRESIRGPVNDHAPREAFRLLQRDLYIPPGAVGFWQIAWREGEEPVPPQILQAIEEGEVIVELLYGDFEGGQRVITRFMSRREDDGAWALVTGRHWWLDRADVRPRD
jgi:hypothetical protein